MEGIQRIEGGGGEGRGVQDLKGMEGIQRIEGGGGK